ncbi:ABC transporter ATP-binding protein [Arthrobacter bambusae]|uniref:ABC transporter ATP-binding protein n=1 Tax=Arthrobacter bambusae TaxID=1338426 RepID=UPI001F509279|nr:ABC transporter ATP-binding protein [Arthrobacter bambusae]MCI0144081.1 ABC transporter ATP-binding protein [Arthrobacter bambusae]
MIDPLSEVDGAAEAQLSIRGLRKTYDNGKVAIRGLDLDVRRGEIVSLLGPSGCGKTTTLRSIAGLEQPDSGSIAIAGRTVFSHNSGQHDVLVPPEKRGLSMVFQQYALWPNMDVYENIAFGMRVKNMPKEKIIAETEKALRRVRLWNERDRRIGQLSGGQQQRVALARAVAGSPKLVLFDEPLSNLDTQLREGMRLELLELQNAMGFTAIFVTHDQDEALSISSRILVMNDGGVEQLGTPEEIWEQPATAFVAGFIGSTNRLRGRVTTTSGNGATVAIDDGPDMTVLNRTGQLRAGQEVEVYLRTESLRTSEFDPGSGPNVWQVPLLLNSFRGEFVLLQVGFGGHRLLCRGERGTTTASERVFLHVNPRDIFCYPITEPAEELPENKAAKR